MKINRKIVIGTCIFIIILVFILEKTGGISSNFKYIIEKESDNSIKESEYIPISKRLHPNVNDEWGLRAIKIDNLSNIDNKKHVIVAVIDTGVNLSGEQILQGYNIIDNSKDTQDRYIHGTNIASLILKVAPNSLILPVKVIEKDQELNPELVAEGIEWAIIHGAQVINLSAGMPNENNSIKKAINKAIDLNIPVISSSGNNGNSYLSFPSSMESVISVMARDINNIDASFSNKDINKRSFSAPGVYIKVEENYVSGTSYAAAFVTGTVSLIKSVKTDITIATIINLLKKTAVDGNIYSYGLIQTDKLMSLVH